ncbi:flavodoxin [Dehalobacterium formicoaceticum]|uniref:flavodoxin n=1 Tax=Dehalobacterium formicoaceticum TaxID=51515 RepID=UPI000B7EF814|nr:flavodoxin [Dehalobacterium formicoaceticum]
MAQLIVYFSRAGNNYVNGAIKNLPVGNTEIAAKMMQELTGGDLFKIEPLVKYSADYNECIAEAQADLKRDARPELEAYPDSLNNYDTIYLGYPNYWGTIPMAVFTFLEHFDFTGKRIKPFCTHEGSGMGKSESDIKKLCKGAIVEKGLAIHGAKVNDAQAAIKKWI